MAFSSALVQYRQQVHLDVELIQSKEHQSTNFPQGSAIQETSISTLITSNAISSEHNLKPNLTKIKSEHFIPVRIAQFAQLLKNHLEDFSTNSLLITIIATLSCFFVQRFPRSVALNNATTSVLLSCANCGATFAFGDIIDHFLRSSRHFSAELLKELGQIHFPGCTGTMGYQMMLKEDALFPVAESICFRSDNFYTDSGMCI